MPIEIVTSRLRAPCWMANGSVAMRRRSRSATMVATAMSVSGITMHEFLAAVAAGEIDVADRLADAQREFAQHVVAGVVAVAVVDRLEVVDVEHQHRDRLAARGRLLDQRRQMRFHVAAVEQAGERVGDRHLDRHLHVVAQPLGVALLLDLRAHARQHLVLVDRADQVVVDADLEPAHQPRIVVGFGDGEDRHVAGALERADLAAQAQRRRNSSAPSETITRS